MIEQPICAHGFNSTICVAPAGHAGAHVTSNERFPHGLAIIQTMELTSALPAPEPPQLTTAMLATALDDVFETTQWEGKGASIAPGLYAALKSRLGAALPAEPAPPDLLTAFTRRLETLARERNWTDDHDARLVCEAAVGVLRTILGAALPPDPKRLSEIRARLDAATPGPWKRGGFDRDQVERGDGAPIATIRAVDGIYTSFGHNARATANADLIAHAPGDIQFLLEVVGGSRPALAGSAFRPSDYDWLLLEMNLARLTDELNRIPELRREDELQLAKASLETVRGWRK